MNYFRRWAVFVLTAATTIALAQEAEPPKREAGIKPGDAAPPIQAQEWVKGTPCTNLEPGKVYLIEFWARWCGPCIAELPNVKNAFATYHNKGFEVVGITLENPGLRAGETPEQTEAKMAAARKKLMDFCAKEELAWPQQFDGKWWKNEIAVAYSVNAIPAMFLLDQAGKLVTTSARGEKLEAEVKRLLGL